MKNICPTCQTEITLDESQHQPKFCCGCDKATLWYHLPKKHEPTQWERPDKVVVYKDNSEVPF